MSRLHKNEERSDASEHEPRFHAIALQKRAEFSTEK